MKLVNNTSYYSEKVTVLKIN